MPANRVAIFIDGAHLDWIAMNELKVKIDYGKFAQALARVTPAMAAGVTKRVWEIDEIVGLL
mgnify:CR=1 FL=1